MPKITITIEVDEETSQACDAMSREERRKVEMLLGFWLRDLVRKDIPELGSLIAEAGRRAEARGLTPGILDSILSEV